MLRKVYRRGAVTVGGRAQHRRELRHLSTAPWDAPQAMDAMRLGLLAQTVRIAASTSPYYRSLLGGEALHLTSFRDLETIPVTSKVDIIESGLVRTSQGSAARRAAWRTSGSSGQPYVFEVDLGYRARFDAQRAYVYRRAGLPEGSRIIELVGSGTKVKGPRQLSYPTFRRTLVGYGRADLDAVVMGVRPHMLFGNRSHLLEIAEALGPSGRSLPLNFVCSSSETLHLADERDLQDSFGVPVSEVYGSAEAGNLAFRLPDEREWHILEPRVLVEVLGEDRVPVGPGETGEIVVTTLRERTAPLLRYATGDLATVQSGDGRGTSGLRLSALQGRLADAVLAADGQRVGFWSIAYSAFWGRSDIARHVRRWQVHQNSDLSVTVSVETTDEGGLAAVTPAIEEHLRSKLGDLPMTVQRTEQIHPPGKIKFRAVTSDALGS